MLSVLRFVVALMFMQHGMQKIFGFPTPAPQAQPFVLASLVGIAGVIELIGGALVLIGFLTRPAAFLMSGEMAVAYFKVHAAKALWPIANMGESAVIYSFVFLFLAFAGAGAWSVDAMIERSLRKKRMRTIAHPERRIGPRREEDRRKAS